MTDSTPTSDAASKELRERLRQLFSSGEFSDKVRDFVSAPSLGRPLSLFRPLNVILDSAEFKAFRAKPIDEKVLAEIDKLNIDPSIKSGIRKMAPDPRNEPRPNELVESINALRGLLTWAEDKPGCLSGVRSSQRQSEQAKTAPPRIERFAAAPKQGGAQIDGAKPGDAVQIVGSGFSKIASENEVRFHETPARIIKAAPQSLVVLVPTPDLKAEPPTPGQPPKPVFVTGPVNVSVTTPGGTTKARFVIQPLKTKPTQLERDLGRLEAAMRRTAKLLTSQTAALQPLIQADESGAMKTIIQHLPFLLQESAKMFPALAIEIQEVGKIVPALREHLDSLFDPEVSRELDKVEASLDLLQPRPSGNVTLAEIGSNVCPLGRVVDLITYMLSDWHDRTLALIAGGFIFMILWAIPVFIALYYESLVIIILLHAALVLEVICIIATTPWPSPESAD